MDRKYCMCLTVPRTGASNWGVMQRSATHVSRVQIEKLHLSQAHAWCRLAYQMGERVLCVMVGRYNSTLGSSTWARASGGAHVRHRMARRFPRGLDSTSYNLAGAITWLIHRVLRRLNGASLQTRQQPSKVGSVLEPTGPSNPETVLPKLSGNFGRITSRSTLLFAHVTIATARFHISFRFAANTK